MKRFKTLLTLAALVVAAPARAQQPAPAAPVGPAVGEMAPDFEFQGVTRYGGIGTRSKLSDYRGKAVILAFFPKARSRG